MDGGGLLATGSSSCIVKPNIPCKGKKTLRNNKKISKIVFGKKSKEYINNENKINKLIKDLPGYNDWTMVFDKMCKPPPYDEIKKIDKDVFNCTENLTSDRSKNKQLFDKNSIMLIGNYGGKTLEHHFEEEFENAENYDFIELDYKFLKFMEKLKYIFIGLHVMRENRISHLDVKPNNIVLDGKYFKFIDYGISSEFLNLNHFKNRAKNESKTNRLYLWYPSEYLFSQMNIKMLNDIEKQLNKKPFDEFKQNSKDYKNIQELSFNRDSEKHFKKLINKYKSKEWNIDLENMIKGIDVYSLGLMIPYLFYKYELLYRVKHSKILIRFFSLFDLMTRNYFRDRIHIGEARVLYEGLINKYYIKNYKKFRINRSKDLNKYIKKQKILEKKKLKPKYKNKDFLKSSKKSYKKSKKK